MADNPEKIIVRITEDDSEFRGKPAHVLRRLAARLWQMAAKTQSTENCRLYGVLEIKQ